MSTAKDKMKQKIKNKVSQNKAYRDKSAKRLGPNGITVQFIEAVEKVQRESKGPLDFETGLIREANLLHKRMQSIDPDIDIEIIWNHSNNMERWEDLQVEGIHIKWSKWYRGKHPFSDSEKIIDVGNLFLEGYLTSD